MFALACADVLPPPPDLFDLLLIDETHHSPAKTWQAVLDARPQAKRAQGQSQPRKRLPLMLEEKAMVLRSWILALLRESLNF